MSNARDKERKADKVRAVSRRINEIYINRDLLLPMMDEHQIDMLILALGIGSVALNEDQE